MAQLPTGILSHSQKVCRLYKRVLQISKASTEERLVWRLDAVRLRKVFDDNAHIQDLRLAKHLISEVEKKIYWLTGDFWEMIIFPDSVGGISHGREVPVPDSVLDQWHPMEKAMFPKYFARREQRKKEFVEWYYKQFPEKKVESEKSLKMN